MSEEIDYNFSGKSLVELSELFKETEFDCTSGKESNEEPIFLEWVDKHLVAVGKSLHLFASHNPEPPVTHIAANGFKGIDCGAGKDGFDMKQHHGYKPPPGTDVGQIAHPSTTRTSHNYTYDYGIYDWKDEPYAEVDRAAELAVADKLLGQ